MSDAASRRPIRSRGWAVFQRSAAWLARVGVSPNVISLSSIVFGVLAGAALAASNRTDAPNLARLLWLSAAVGIQLRLIANLLDGLVAVEGGRRSATGELYNEAPDRVSDTAILVGAGYAAGGSPLAGAAAAIVALFVANVRALGASVGVGQVFAGPMAKQQRMAVVTVVELINVVRPSEPSVGVLVGDGPVFWGLCLIVCGGLLTAVNRLSIIAARLRGAGSDDG